MLMQICLWLWRVGSSSACPVDLYLISEKSIWKNQVQWTGILVYFKLNFYCLCSLQKSISKLILASYTGSKNQVWNRLKIQFIELDFSKLIFQISSTDQHGVNVMQNSPKKYQMFMNSAQYDQNQPKSQILF